MVIMNRYEQNKNKNTLALIPVLIYTTFHIKNLRDEVFYINTD